MTIMNKGRIFINPAINVAPCACDTLLAARSLCTITYNRVHLYYTLMAGFIKILPLFMMVMPGMISRILYTGKNSI
jgi:hypothetical protein